MYINYQIDWKVIPKVSATTCHFTIFPLVACINREHALLHRNNIKRCNMLARCLFRAYYKFILATLYGRWEFLLPSANDPKLCIQCVNLSQCTHDSCTNTSNTHVYTTIDNLACSITSLCTKWVTFRSFCRW